METFSVKKSSSSLIKNAFINIRNYLAGQLVGATRDDTLLDETLKCLFIKLVLEKNNELSLLDDSDLLIFAKNIRKKFNQVKEIYPEVFESDSELLLDPKSLRYVFNELNFSLLNTDSDPVGDAFEIFIGAQSKGNSGQFFTPKLAVNLLVEVIAPKPTDLILDPACGAGGFLTSSINYIKSHYSDSIKEIAIKNIYGIDKDSYLAKLAKSHLILTTEGSANIFDADSLSFKSSTGYINELLPENGFDIILTNPPFGSKIVAAEENVLKTFQLAYKWKYDKKNKTFIKTDELLKNVPPQILFIERCIKLLKPNGKLGIVLPESVLSNKSYTYAVEYILANLKLNAIIGMPEALFKTSGKGGTHTKTCLIIAEKKIAQNYDIYMAEAEWCGHDSRAREIPNNDIPIIKKELIDYFNNETTKPKFGFILNSKNILNNILCPRYYKSPIDTDNKDLLKNFDLITFGDLLNQNVISYITGDEVGKLAYGTGTIPFVRTSDISNWEIKNDPKHGISEEIYLSLKEKQDVQENDLLMVKDGSYLIGTCALITKNDLKMIFQSHLYKIRVNTNSYGITPFLLLSLLNSEFVHKQIKSKQFTQDIIDSLGDRIKEIKLPIPKDEKMRKKIEENTEEIILLRSKAKVLTREVLTSLADNLPV